MYGFINLSRMQSNRIVVNWVFELILKSFTDISAAISRIKFHFYFWERLNYR